jgi:hypothetical protein
MVFESHFEMQLREEGEVDAAHCSHAGRQRPGGYDDHVRGDRRPIREGDGGSGDVGHRPGDQGSTVVTGSIEHPLPQVLGSKPPGSRDEQAANRLFGEKRVGPAQLIRRNHRGSCPEPADLVGLARHAVQSLLNAGDEQIPVPVETELDFESQFLEDVDRAVHEFDHRAVGPPVPVRLGRLVGGEGEGGSGVDDEHPSHVARDAKLVGGRHAGDPGTNDNDVGGLAQRRR